MADGESEVADAPASDGKGSGVVYLSRVPPGMQPHHVKTLLASFGETGRVYLDPMRRGDGKYSLERLNRTNHTTYREGWVEFLDRRHARRAAECLNGQMVGGRKTGKWREDLWNIKYLRGFRWSHLTERLTHENAVREHKMRLEIAQSRKELAQYQANVEISIRQKRRALRSAPPAEPSAAPGAGDAFERLRQRFKQRRVVSG